MTSRITLEVTVTTLDEAVRAVAAGADRLELCAVLDVGGVTPSMGVFLQTRERLPDTPILCARQATPRRFLLFRF